MVEMTPQDSHLHKVSLKSYIIKFHTNPSDEKTPIIMIILLYIRVWYVSNGSQLDLACPCQNEMFTVPYITE